MTKRAEKARKWIAIRMFEQDWKESDTCRRAYKEAIEELSRLETTNRREV